MLKKIKTNNYMNESSAVVVGGSLSGLMTGIALAREGLNVTILEKADEERGSGAGLQVDSGGFNLTKTAKILRNLASDGKRSIQLWSSIESNLRKEAQSDKRINLRFNTRVQSVHQNNDAAWVITDQGEIFQGDILIGADGHSSLVRHHIVPDNPNATFAGYVVWFASIDENELDEAHRPGYNEPPVRMLNSPDGFIFGSVIGTSQSGSRRIGCTWYDNSRNDLLRQLGCIEGSIVKHSLKGNDIPKEDLNELAVQATNKWSEPWLSAALHSIETRNLTGIPIKEYVPDQLVKGRVALIGDAAHVPAPITASGFNASLDDAVELGKCVASGIQGEAANKALEKYESVRLSKVRRMVQSGKSFSASFGRA